MFCGGFVQATPDIRHGPGPMDDYPARRADARREAIMLHTAAPAQVRPLAITIGGQTLHGDFARPADAKGLVLFAHGSGSSRHSPRNRRVAGTLGSFGFATLLFDLLTPTEERLDEVTRGLRFDIDLLASRVAAVVDWLTGAPETAALPIGLFGASTGAAAALVAAAVRPNDIAAVVSRGGRPDLAGDALAHVIAPTLLIVGSLDREVLALNRQAMSRMPGEVELQIIEGATHLFEEPGTLDRVATAAARWFTDYVKASRLVER
jgi:putative phosphoribosyl transferase